MKECINCINKTSCKIYDALTYAKAYGTIAFNDCMIKNSNESDSCNLSVPSGSIEQKENLIDKCFNLNNDNNKTIKMSEIIPKIKDTHGIMCSNCLETIDKKEELVTCEKCNKNICINCATLNIKTGGYLCENCWSKA